MMSDESDLRERTVQFALRIIKLCNAVGSSGALGTIGRQLLRSGTSVGAQYREACRARSTAEFISKMESASQELDESMYWLDLLARGNMIKPKRLEPLNKEANELMAIFVASVRTAKRSRSRDA